MAARAQSFHQGYLVKEKWIELPEYYIPENKRQYNNKQTKAKLRFV